MYGLDKYATIIDSGDYDEEIKNKLYKHIKNMWRSMLEKQ